MFEVHLLLGDDVHALTDIRDELIDERSRPFDLELNRQFRFDRALHVAASGAEVTCRLTPEDKCSQTSGDPRSHQQFLQHGCDLLDRVTERQMPFRDPAPLMRDTHETRFSRVLSLSFAGRAGILARFWKNFRGHFKTSPTRKRELRVKSKRSPRLRVGLVNQVAARPHPGSREKSTVTVLRPVAHESSPVGRW